MGVVITARDKSLDITLDLNKRSLFLIVSIAVWDEGMLNIAFGNRGQNEAPALEITLSGEVTGFDSR